MGTNVLICNVEGSFRNYMYMWKVSLRSIRLYYYKIHFQCFVRMTTCTCCWNTLWKQTTAAWVKVFYCTVI